MKIQVEESALDAISAMAKKLQEERDELLDCLKDLHAKFAQEIGLLPKDCVGGAFSKANALIAKCTAKPAMWESK